MSNIMIITPNHTWGKSKNRVVEKILFIQQLLEKMGQRLLEYCEDSEKHEGVLYHNNVHFACTFLLAFRTTSTACKMCRSYYLECILKQAFDAKAK